jgi:RNase H-like domain found in reverse transcriptase
MRIHSKRNSTPLQLRSFKTPSSLRLSISIIHYSKKNGTVRVVSEFRVLNSKLQRVSFPIPRIQDILTSLNGFTYATSIDSIVETLNEFRTMPLGYCIKIYTDHENLTRLTTVSKSPRIQRWRWTIEEFGPTIEYIKGPQNVVADALSRLDTEVSSTTASSKQIAELYENADDESLQDLDYPLSTQIIAEHQRSDQTLIQNQQSHPEYFSKTVDGQQVILF